MRWLVVLSLVLAVVPQGKKAAPDVCPWCKNDPALMATSGVVSHGPISIGAEGSEKLAALLPTAKWVFAETAHIRWASSLGEDTVELADRARVDAELARLRLVLPNVPVKPKKLDPYLRMHLMAMKGEELFTRFEKLLHVTDADFPEERQPKGPYMGNGRFLGEKDKFEVVIHATRASHATFTENFSGVVVRDSLRWHFPKLHKLLISIPAEDPDLREDKWLWPHTTHNLTHVFFWAYKHYSYDAPSWIDEGLAMALEKEAEPRSRTTEGEEGALRDDHLPEDYADAARKLVAAGKQRRLAELMQAKTLADLGTDGSVTAWSMARFLIDAHGEELAKFLGGLKGQLDARGYPTGADMPGLERKWLKDVWGWTPADLDTAWAAWVAAQTQ